MCNAKAQEKSRVSQNMLESQYSKTFIFTSQYANKATKASKEVQYGHTILHARMRKSLNTKAVTMRHKSLILFFRSKYLVVWSPSGAARRLCNHPVSSGPVDLELR